MELGNHSEFLGVMTRAEMLAMYFVHDGGETSKWRLKGHAADLFWRWLSSWCVVMDDPKKLGYTCEGYDLPKLSVHEIVVDGEQTENVALSLTERREARRDSLTERCKAAADLVNSSDDNWLCWCDLNAEADELHRLIPGSVNVQGSDTPEFKTSSMLDFAAGKLKCLVTKPKIAGYGMNWAELPQGRFRGAFGQLRSLLSGCAPAAGDSGRSPMLTCISSFQRRRAQSKKISSASSCDNEQMKEHLIELTKDITRRELTATVRISTEYEPHKAMRLPEWEEMKHYA